jgi:hypothetical protein
MAVTKTNVPLLLLVGLGVAACAIGAQRSQDLEKRAEVYLTDCERSLGLVRGQPITDGQRADLKWCVTTLWAKDKLREGSQDVGTRFLGLYIPNCEALLGKDWGEVGSEKRMKLVACVQMQAERDMEWENKMDRALLLQGMHGWTSKQTPINCFTYGNWTQCR